MTDPHHASGESARPVAAQLTGGERGLEITYWLHGNEQMHVDHLEPHQTWVAPDGADQIELVFLPT